MAALLNNEWACGICRRRADGVAVGRPGRLLWRCDECGVERAKEVFHMPTKEFDVFEKRALQKVRDQLVEGDLVVPDGEVMTFLEWLVNDFAEAIRKEIDSGKPPF